MGKTVKGSKGAGYDYWSKISNSEGKYTQCPGKLSKKIKRRKVRRQAKKEVR